MGRKLLLSIILSTYSLVNANDSLTKSMGDILYILIPTSTYAATYYTGDEEGRIEFYNSFAANVVVTYGLKLSVHASRPDESDNNSFPSGHTSATFQSAAFLHKRYGLKYALLPYLGASFVAYSRVYEKKHYVRDVIGGAIIGILSSWYFTSRYKSIEAEMVLNERYKGILVSYKW